MLKSKKGVISILAIIAILTIILLIGGLIFVFMFASEIFWITAILISIVVILFVLKFLGVI